MKNVYTNSIRTDSELVGEEFENELFFCQKMSLVKTGSRSYYTIILSDKTGEITGITSNSSYPDLTNEQVLVHGLVSLSKDKPVVQIYSMRKAPEMEREDNRTKASLLVCSVSQKWSVENMQYLNNVLQQFSDPYRKIMDRIVRKKGVVVKMSLVPVKGFEYNGGNLDGLCYILHLIDALFPVEVPADVYAAYPLDYEMIRAALILYYVGVSVCEVSLPQKRDSMDCLSDKSYYAAAYITDILSSELEESKKRKLLHCIRALGKEENPVLQEAEVLVHLVQIAEIRGSYSHAVYMGDHYVNGHPLFKEE